MPSESEIKQIIDLYNKGLSQGQIAQAMGKGKTTVHEWLHGLFKTGELKERTNGERSATKKATDAKRTFDRERRLALNDLWFEKIEALLLNANDAKSLGALAIPYGVTEDKRRLLEPTSADGEESGLEQMRKALKRDMEIPSTKQ